MLSRELTRCAAANNRLPYLLLIFVLLLWGLPASAAPKTDTVIFKNGDKLTGEVKSLKRGRLSFDTDATGQISIEWDKVAGIISDQQIQVETVSGVRYFGTLTSSEEDPSVIVETFNGPELLDPKRVIVMSPIEGGGIHALDVDLSVGYNFAKAGGIESGNFGINMDYRSLLRIESFSFSTTISNSDTQEESRRSNATLQHTRLWKNRWFTNGSLAAEQNDELGLTLRTSFGGNIGRYLVQSNSMLWSLEAGLQVAREDLVAEPEDVDSLEATFVLKWDWFLFQNPELDWSTEIEIFPSITESGRVRGEADTSLSWEIIGDLKWGVAIYSSFDSQPQSSTGSTSDYGVNTTVTYDF